MNFAEKSIVVNRDFDIRFCKNFLESIKGIKSNIYFATLNNNVSAKSIIGLLSAKIKDCDTIRINVLNDDIEQAEKDLKFVESVIFDGM
jgi:phosphotransferase system HPr-like phosphotransfer protein